MQGRDHRLKIHGFPRSFVAVHIIDAVAVFWKESGEGMRVEECIGVGEATSQELACPEGLSGRMAKFKGKSIPFVGS
jgi:hypothetical protein